jgi:hypothetical protein
LFNNWVMLPVQLSQEERYLCIFPYIDYAS